MHDESRSSEPEREELSIAEKILRVQDLWDDIARTPDEVEVTPAQLEEAERRLAEHRRNPQPCETWESIKQRLIGES